MIAVAPHIRGRNDQRRFRRARSRLASFESRFHRMLASRNDRRHPRRTASAGHDAQAGTRSIIDFEFVGIVVAAANSATGIRYGTRAMLRANKERNIVEQRWTDERRQARSTNWTASARRAAASAPSPTRLMTAARSGAETIRGDRSARATRAPGHS